MNAPAPKNRLGRGLASLIGDTPTIQAVPKQDGDQGTLRIDQMRGGKLNPRRDFPDSDLQELADSIRMKGLVQPIVVRPDPAEPGMYEIVAGERRWRAAQRAAVHTVPVIIRDLTDQEVLELAIIENVQRADLNAIEEAAGYRDLIERFSYSQEKVSDIIGKSRSHVANTLRLLKLPDEVQKHVQEGRLTAGHARALVGRADAEALAQQIIERDLNVRDVEALVQGGLGPIGEPGSSGARKAREKDADTRAFEKDLTDSLGLKVEIKRGSGESGNLVIKYGNFDQLEYIRLRLAGQGG